MKITMNTVLLLYLKGWRESAGGEERMPPAYYCYVKAFVTKYTVLLLYLKGWRESAGGEERIPPAYYCYVKAFVTKYTVLYRRPNLPSAFEQIKHSPQKRTHNRTVKANTLHIGINLTAHHLCQTFIGHCLQNSLHNIAQHRLSLQQA